MRPLPLAAVDFIEQISILAESAGATRVGGRIAGLLIFAQEPLTIDELASALQISRGSICSNTRLLEERGVIRRVSHLGERKTLFEIDRGLPEQILERSLAEQRRVQHLAGEARRKLPDRCAAAIGAMRRMEDCASTAAHAIEEMLASWRSDDVVRQDEAHAGRYN